jgi:hypothetical protein
MELLLTEAKQNGAPESRQNVAPSDRQSRMELPSTETNHSQMPSFRTFQRASEPIYTTRATRNDDAAAGCNITSKLVQATIKHKHYR